MLHLRNTTDPRLELKAGFRRTRWRERANMSPTQMTPACSTSTLWLPSTNKYGNPPVSRNTWETGRGGFKKNRQPLGISSCKKMLFFQPNVWLQRASFESCAEKGLYHCSIYTQPDLHKFKAPQVSFCLIRVGGNPLFTSKGISRHFRNVYDLRL